MSLLPLVKNEDWNAVRRNFQLLSSGLRMGPDAEPTFGGLTLSKTCTVANGLNILRVTGLQTDGTAMTGTLQGAYIDVSNGDTAATGTIRAMELKARTEAPGDSGSNVNVLEGLSISADSKDHSVTTMRGAEFILDGSTGGTITEAVGLRIANNLQANKATTSYGLQIYRDSFDYTADIQLSGGGTIGGSSGAMKLSSTGELTLSYDSSNYSVFSIGSGGDLTITSSGGDISLGDENLTTTGDGSFSDLTISSSGNAQGTLSLSNSTLTASATFTGLTLDYTKTSGTSGALKGIEIDVTHNNDNNLSNLYAIDIAVDFKLGTLTGESYLFNFSAEQSGGTIEDDIYCQHNYLSLNIGTLEDDAHGFFQKVVVGTSHSGIDGDLFACELDASDAYDKVAGKVYVLHLKGSHADYGIWDASGANWALDGDNQKILFGEGQDASIYYNATDLVINPKEVGTGKVNLNAGDLTTTGAGHFGGALDTDSTLVVDGTMAVGTTIDSAKSLNVYSSGSTISRGAYFSVLYSGTSQSCYGIYCQVLGRSTNDNPRAYGGRFQGVNYRMKDQTGLAGTYGGDFRAQDYQNTVYGTAGGTYQFYCGYFYTPNAAGDWTTHDPTVKTYRLFLTGTPTGFGDNHTDYAIYSQGGQSVHAGNLRIGSTTDPVRTLDVTGDATFGGTTNYAKFDTNGELTLYGTARVLNHLRIPAQVFKKVVGGSPPEEKMEGIITTLDFDDSANEQVYYVEVSPFRMDATVDIEIEIDWMFDANQADNTKKVKWGVEYISLGAGEAVDGATTTTTQLSAGNHNTGQGNIVRTNFETGLTGIAIGDIIGIRVFRDAVNDDFVGDARLIVLHLHFTTNKLGKTIT